MVRVGYNLYFKEKKRKKYICTTFKKTQNQTKLSKYSEWDEHLDIIWLSNKG